MATTSHAAGLTRRWALPPRALIRALKNLVINIDASKSLSPTWTQCLKVQVQPVVAQDEVAPIDRAANPREYLRVSAMLFSMREVPVAVLLD